MLLDQKKSCPKALTTLFFRRLSMGYGLFLLLMLLMPFRFTLNGDLIIRQMGNTVFPWNVRTLLDLSLWADLVQNLVLFLPFGFFLSEAAVSRGRILFYGFCTSLLAEGLQAFSPARVPSLYDLLMNTSGTVLGAYLAGRFHKPVARCIWRGLSLPIPLKLLRTLALISLCFGPAALFVPLVPAHGLRWRPDANLYLGGAPGSTVFWAGTVHRIAFWSKPVSTFDAPDVNLDFQSRAAALRHFDGDALPEQVDWNNQGVVLSGCYVRLSRETVRLVSQAIGVGRSYSLLLEVTPLESGFRQEGQVLTAGRDIWTKDFGLEQEGDTISLFSRTSISGETWRKPVCKYKGAVKDNKRQAWVFQFNGRRMTGMVNGRPMRDGLFLCWHNSMAGLLLASPLVIEALTLYILIFMVSTLLCAKWLFGLSGMNRITLSVYAGITLVLPMAMLFVLFALRRLPLDGLSMAAIPLASLLGGYLGHVWACARPSRELP